MNRIDTKSTHTSIVRARRHVCATIIGATAFAALAGCSVAPPDSESSFSATEAAHLTPMASHVASYFDDRHAQIYASLRESGLDPERVEAEARAIKETSDHDRAVAAAEDFSSRYFGAAQQAVDRHDIESTFAAPWAPAIPSDMHTETLRAGAYTSCSTRTIGQPFTVPSTSDPNAVATTDGKLLAHSQAGGAGEGSAQARLETTFRPTNAEARMTITAHVRVDDASATAWGSLFGYARAQVSLSIAVAGFGSGISVFCNEAGVDDRLATAEANTGSYTANVPPGTYDVHCPVFLQAGGSVDSYSIAVDAIAYDVAGGSAGSWSHINATLLGIDVETCIEPNVITGNGGLCLDTADGALNQGESVVLQQCNGDAGEHWELDTNLRLRSTVANTLCLEDDRDAVRVAPCTSMANQQWMYFSSNPRDNRLLNMSTALFLTAQGGALAAVRGGPFQAFQPGPPPLAQPWQSWHVMRGG